MIRAPITLSVLTLLVLSPSLLARETYDETISRHRQIVDRIFSTASLSPLPTGDLAGFAGLRYFPIDPGQRRVAHFEPAGRSAVFHLPTTGEATEAYKRYGRLSFVTVFGESASLSVFEREDRSGVRSAIIPFKDLSNGHSTYSGGRYLKLELPLDDPPRVDFNRAENPYCAYDPRFACPIPPRVNHLDFAVLAGEMDYR